MLPLRVLFVLAFQVLATACLAGDSASSPDVYTYHHDHVLGTSLEIQVRADSEPIALAAEARVLAEINRLSKIFSTYDANSEFSRWQRDPKAATRVSPELFEMLAASDRWQRLSNGAFQPGVEQLSRLWRDAQKQNTLPTPAELQAAVALVNQAHWKLDVANQTATRSSDCPSTLNAIAKGAIVEWACRAASQVPEVRGLMVNLGGDLRVCGDAVQEISIANPLKDAVNAAPIAHIFVANRAVATSGNYRRGFQVGDKWYSHILDPRTGLPAGDIISATVVAESSADADAVATICNVLPVQESLALVKSLKNVDCLLVTKDGQQFQTEGWNELTSPRLFRFGTTDELLAFANDAQKDKDAEKPAAQKSDEKATPELHELLVKFELDRPTGTQYRRPYVAVWLEDEDEFPVKTAVLWMTTKQPGPRWHRDLLRWYRNDGVRKLADGTQLIGTISSATRGPGEYKAVFDGLDDAGKPLKPGKYTLYLEAAREHGTYQIIRHQLVLGADPIKEIKLKSNAEFKAASVEYRPHEAKPAANDAK